MLAAIKEEMDSILKKELSSFKREIKEEIESSTKTDKVLKKKIVPPRPLISISNVISVFKR